MSSVDASAALTELRAWLKPEQFTQDTQDLNVYGKDWTTYYDIKPLAIVFPLSTEDVQKIVLWARKHLIALVPSGGRTGLSGGACATKGEVVVSFSKMNRIKDFSSIDQTVVVEAGVVTEELQNFAIEKGLFYPVDFAATGSSQMGGNIATNAGGIKVVRYGMTRAWISGLKAVTGTGDIIEANNGLSKNATGYDLRHLMIGSEGTLGLVCEARIQLLPKPGPSKVLLMGLTSLEAIMKTFERLKTTQTLVAFEMFSDLALSKVMAQKHASAPFAEKFPYYVLTEVEAESELQETKLLESFEFILENGWAGDGLMAQSETQAQEFWSFRENISESLAPFSPYKNDISVRVSKVPDLMRELDPLFAKSYPTWEVVWFGHVGDGNLHINILRSPGLSKEDFLRECRKVDEVIFRAVQKFQGAISAEHGVGLSKRDFLSYSRSEAEISLMRGIKKVFDPDGIMNPGKLI